MKRTLVHTLNSSTRPRLPSQSKLGPGCLDLWRDQWGRQPAPLCCYTSLQLVSEDALHAHPGEPFECAGTHSCSRAPVSSQSCTNSNTPQDHCTITNFASSSRLTALAVMNCIPATFSWPASPFPWGTKNCHHRSLLCIIIVGKINECWLSTVLCIRYNKYIHALTWITWSWVISLL